MANTTILLIDYEPRSIERFRQPLTSAGYKVEIATDGLAGIEAFHRLNPDMVLVEAMIPKKHGFEVCQELKRTPHGRRTPILITTGVYKGRKYRTQALHIYGCDEYIEKPIAPEQLLAVVGKFFGGSGGTARAGSDEAAAAPSDRPSDEPGPARRTPGPAGAPSVDPTDAGPEIPRMKSSHAPIAVVSDLTEEEIMARLDAILPGGENSASAIFGGAAAPAPDSATNTVSSDVLDEPAGAEAAVDPFAQMQAELKNELGELSAALDSAPAPFLEEEPPSIPSDQAVLPSLLETLPVSDDAPAARTEPIVMASAVRVPEAVPYEAVPAPSGDEPPQGRVVNFDTKRSRKNKRGGKRQGEARGATRAEPAPPPLEVHPAEPAPAGPAARSIPAETEYAVPEGSLVASALDPTAKPGIPTWVWVAAAAVLLIGCYVLFFRGGSASQTPALDSSIPASTAPAVSEPSVPPGAAPAEAAPAEVPPSAEPIKATNRPAEQKPAATKGAETAVQTAASTSPAHSAPSPGKPAASLAPETRGGARPDAEARSAAPAPAPAAVSAATKSKREAPVEPPADAPAGVGGANLTSVEAIAPTPAQEARPAVAPGSLVALSAVDTPPVALTRKLPVYSLQARQMRIQGTVVLKVLVNEQGGVDNVEIVSGVRGADVNDSAVKAAKQFTYRPATMEGVPVKVWKTESISFKL